MTPIEPVDLGQLQDTLSELVIQIHKALNDDDRLFLLDLKQGIVDWRKFPLSEVQMLPAIQWKQLNNDDLSRGFTVAQVSEKHGWTDPKVWILALEGKKDHDRFKALGWGFRTWDQWEWNDCDNRFGDDWPGRIPAQLTANIFIKKGSGYGITPISSRRPCRPSVSSR